jgi:hypothetical protein
VKETQVQGQSIATETSGETVAPDEQTQAAEANAPQPTPSATGRAIPPPHVVGGVVAALLAVASAAVLVCRAGEPRVSDDEHVALSVRPRRGFWRYVTTLGLWEVKRLATRFTVTDRRLVVQTGLAESVTRVVPLAGIGSVVVRTGPFEGYVEVGQRTPGRSARVVLGPLSGRGARRLATAIEAGQRGAR